MTIIWHPFQVISSLPGAFMPLFMPINNIFRNFLFFGSYLINFSLKNLSNPDSLKPLKVFLIVFNRNKLEIRSQTNIFKNFEVRYTISRLGTCFFELRDISFMSFWTLRRQWKNFGVVSKKRGGSWKCVKT